MRVINVDPVIENLQNAICLGKRLEFDVTEHEAILRDIEAQPPVYERDIITKDKLLMAFTAEFFYDMYTDEYQYMYKWLEGLFNK